MHRQSPKNQRKQRALLGIGRLRVVAVVGLVLAFLWVAFWNGYPTFYPDSGTYVECGFLLETPVDRPITYGLFLAATSLGGLTLWTTVVAQTLLLCFTTVAFVRLFLPNGWFLPVVVPVIVSGVSFLASQVMTDVFTSIMIMSMVLFALSKKHRIRWLAVYTVTCAMHTSHLPVALLLLPLLVVATRMIVADTWLSALKKTWGLLATTIVAYIALNISVVKSTEVFYAAHLAQTWDLNEFLHRKCPEANYELCALRDSLPQTADEFLWDEGGIAHSYPNRGRMKADLGKIIGDMLQDRISQERICQSTLRYGTKQLTTFDAGEGNTRFPPSSSLHRRMERYFGHELGQFEGMRQNEPDSLGPSLYTLNQFYRTATYASLLVLCCCLVLMIRAGERRFVICTLFVIAAYVLNCFVNAGLVVVASRFGAKLIWLFPFLAAISIVWLVANRQVAFAKSEN